MKRIKILFVMAFAFALVSCGGGSSDTGSGGNAGQYAGTYQGGGQVTIRGGGQTQTLQLNFSLVVDQAGNFRYVDTSGLQVTGTIPNGTNTGTVNIAASTVLQDPSCVGTVTYIGTFNGTNIRINISSNGVSCSVGPVSGSGVLNGTKV